MNMKDTTRQQVSQLAATSWRVAQLVAMILTNTWFGRYNDDAGNFKMVEFTHDLTWTGEDVVSFLLERGYIVKVGKIEVCLEKMGSTVHSDIYDLTDSGREAAERCVVAMTTAL